MTTLGLTFPKTDPSIKYGVGHMNSIIELGRNMACSANVGLKQIHMVMLYIIDMSRNNLEYRKDLEKIRDLPCDKMKIVQKSFDNYVNNEGPEILLFEKWKELFLNIESDVMGLVCVNNKVNPEQALDNFEKITRSSYKSICGSDENLIPMTPYDLNEWKASQDEFALRASDTTAKASDATAKALLDAEETAKESGVVVDEAKGIFNKLRGILSCQSEFSVPFMLGVLFTALLLGIFLGFLICKMLKP